MNLRKYLWKLKIIKFKFELDIIKKIIKRSRIRVKDQKRWLQNTVRIDVASLVSEIKIAKESVFEM